jgi:hypothetical protein
VVASSGLSAAVGLSAGLLNHTSFRVFVQLTETGGQTSAWAHSDFNTSFTPPSTPTLTATYDATNGRTALAVAVTSSTPVAVTLTVQSSDDGGASWQTLRWGNAVSVGTLPNTVTVYDYEAPAGLARQYVAFTQTSTGLPSLLSTVRTVTPAPLTPWLKCPLNPSLNTALAGLVGIGDMVIPQGQGTFVALGRSDAIIVRDVVQLRQGSHTIYASGRAQLLAIEALLFANQTLLLQVPTEEAGQPGDNIYLVPTPGQSGFGVSRVADLESDPGRLITVPWVEQVVP